MLAWEDSMGSAKRAGVWICLSAMVALGALEAFYRELLPGLHAYPEGVATWLLRASGLTLAFAAIATATDWRIGALLLAACWLIACSLALSAALGAPGDALGYVPFAEAAVFAAFALWRCDERRAWLLLRLAFGAMLLLFGGIHLANRETIASLIPVWMPGAAYWPWLTGGGSVLAGAACVAGRSVQFVAGAVALMYASWLPLVHAQRLFADPASLFEWTFALTAVALAGIALAIAGYAPVATAVSGRAPHSAQDPS
jgi:hypothetical protein